MTTAALWLPKASDDEAVAAITASLKIWLGEWIVGPVPFRVEKANEPQAESVEAAHHDLANLGLACCSARADPDNPSDSAVLAAVGSAMIADLTRRLGAGGLYRFSVLGAGWKLRLALDEPALTYARRSAAGSRRKPTLVPFSQALANEVVKLGCHLGEATLTAGEVAAVAVGDVVVLNRSIKTSVPLTVDHGLPRSGEARISAHEDAFRITITEPLDLLRKN